MTLQELIAAVQLSTKTNVTSYGLFYCRKEASIITELQTIKCHSNLGVFGFDSIDL